MKSFSLALIISGLCLTACTKSPPQKPAAPQVPQTPAAQQSPAPIDASKATRTLSLGSDGDAIAFDKTELSAKPGEIVKLTFKNNVKSSGMQHNWVLVQRGAEDEVARASIAAGADRGWLAEGNPNIIAHTKLINPGESEIVVFRVPNEPGEYPYLCSFPGHSTTMKGKLIVAR